MTTTTWIERVLYEPEILPLYVLLGMISEYMGRVVTDADVIEDFYPNEKAAATQFARMLERFVEIEGIDTSIQRTVGPQGHITFTSPEIADRINAWYGIDARANEEPEDSTTFPIYTGRLRDDVFPGYSHYGPEMNPQYSYLLGVYYRHGSGASFRFANAPSQAGRVADILKHVSCEYVVWTYRGDLIPSLNVVEFTPTWELEVLFGLPITFSKEQFKEPEY